MTDKICKNSSNISLQNDGKIVVCEKEISEIFNDHFCSGANGIGFGDNISSTSDAISKHATHPCVLKIREVLIKNSLAINQETLIWIKAPVMIIYLANCPTLLKVPLHQCSHTSFTHVLKAPNSPWIWNSLCSVMCIKMTTTWWKKLQARQCINYTLEVTRVCCEWSVVCVLSWYIWKIGVLSVKKYSCQSVLTKMIEDWKLAIDENETQLH